MKDMNKNEFYIAVDAVVFTIIHNELKLLLIRRKNPPFKGMFALPGGFVNIDEDIEDAAKRELEEETNVKNIFLKKLTAYGAPKRDPRGRVVSVAFMAIIDAESQTLMAHPEHDALKAEWIDIDDVKELAFDHSKIVEDALEELKYDIQTTNIAAQLLSERFTLAEMQRLYEIILGKTLDKRNFRKRLKSFDILSATHETKMEGAHRPALLYRFRTRKYQAIKEKLHVFV